jgi:hypothetical protein
VVLVALASTVVKDGDNRCPEGAKLSKPELKSVTIYEWRVGFEHVKNFEEEGRSTREEHGEHTNMKKDNMFLTHLAEFPPTVPDPASASLGRRRGATTAPAAAVLRTSRLPMAFMVGA